MTEAEKKVKELEEQLKEAKCKAWEEKKPRLVVEKTPASVRSFVDGDYYVRDVVLDRVITSSFTDNKEVLEEMTARFNAMSLEETIQAVPEVMRPLVLLKVLDKILDDMKEE